MIRSTARFVVGESHEPTARRPSGRVSPSSGEDHRSSSSPGAASGDNRLGFSARHFSSACRVGPGQPPLPTRLVAGCLFSNTCTISPTRCCATDGWRTRTSNTSVARVVFRHEAPFDRSSLTRWRQRLGEEHITALLQESLSVAHRTGAIEIKDLERVAVDTTVQEKAITHPSDARLTHRAIEKLVELAKREDVELQQSYLRLAKRAAILVGATHMRTSSSAPGANSNSCARCSANKTRSDLPKRVTERAVSKRCAWGMSE